MAPAPADVQWINSPPLTMAGLRGKVVLFDLWEYTCINCVRTFDEINRWYEKHHQCGFGIVGVHCPEFDIAYQVSNVNEAVGRFGLPYPVVVHDKFLNWPRLATVARRAFLTFRKRFVRGWGACWERKITVSQSQTTSRLILILSRK